MHDPILTDEMYEAIVLCGERLEKLIEATHMLQCNIDGEYERLPCAAGLEVRLRFIVETDTAAELPYALAEKVESIAALIRKECERHAKVEARRCE